MSYLRMCLPVSVFGDASETSERALTSPHKVCAYLCCVQNIKVVEEENVWQVAAQLDFHYT